MIAKLKGLVDSVGDDWVIIDVGGVGYLVHASGRSLSELPGRGEIARLHIETNVREDAITLFGFSDVEERDMFRLLTSVQGVGAKVGLAILSIMEPSDLQNVIAAQDKTAVTRANGVGPKLAGRIVNELKDKVTAIAFSHNTNSTSTSGNTVVGGDNTVLADAVSALTNLGYRPSEAHAAAVKAMSALGGEATIGALVPAALKELTH